jgi:hypothetical protein
MVQIQYFDFASIGKVAGQRARIGSMKRKHDTAQRRGTSIEGEAALGRRKRGDDTN